MKAIIVEDDHFSAELLSVRLELLGCETLSFASPAAALAVIPIEQPNFIVLDLRFEASELDGFDVIAALQADPVTRDIPVLLHSIYVDPRSPLPEGTETVFGVLPKPFRILELKGLLDALSTERAPKAGRVGSVVELASPAPSLPPEGEGNTLELSK